MSRAQDGARRWPDLLIGLLVLLLLAGFAILLLGQRASPVPVAQAPAPTPVTTPPPVIPGAPGTDLDPATTGTPATATPAEPGAGAQDTDSPPVEASPPATTEPAPASPTQTDAPSTAADQGGAATSTTPPPASASTPAGEVPVVPADPIPAAPVAPPAPQVTVPSAPPASAATAPTAPITTTPQTPPVPTVPPRAGGAVATSEQRTPLRSDYRISLGTFGSTGAAQGGTEGVRALGYTVYPIDLGSQVVAQVGPFADEATARRALADIERVYPRALLYPPRGGSLTGGGAASTRENEVTPTPATPSTPDTPTADEEQAPEAPPAAPAATTQPTPAPSGPVYLQVGAFNRVESAQRLVGLLRDQGYAPTVNAPDDGKVTVLIGPFSGEAVTEAEEKLDANGFDHFRVR